MIISGDRCYFSNEQDFIIASVIDQKCKWAGKLHGFDNRFLFHRSRHTFHGNCRHCCCLRAVFIQLQFCFLQYRIHIYILVCNTGEISIAGK